MKSIKYYIRVVLILGLVFTSCQEKDYEFGDIVAPSNLVVNATLVGQDADNPNGDGSGTVNFTASASDAITYKYIFNGKEDQAANGELTTSFSTTGLHTYDVTVIAYGKGGVSSSKTIQVEVYANYSAPEDLLQMLYGDGEKIWRVKAESAGHFGVGPADAILPDWWGAAPYDKAGKGAYDDRIIFKSDGTITYITNGSMYGQAGALEADFGITAEANSDNEYENYPVEEFTDTYSLSAPEGQETLTFGSKGYHGFYVGGDHSYVILSRTATEMSLRTVGADGNGWFGILTSEEEVAEEGETFESEFNTLAWSDEFDTPGAPNVANWTYDLGAGGWGNQEVQTYTDDASNVIIEDGMLKITAVKDGNDYTSARLKSIDLYEFKYGRVEVSAKVPGAQGTWPAIWMLGANYPEVSWPTCGEIDIMEQTGADKNTSLGTYHWLDNGTNAQASYGETLAIENAASEFHLYGLEWTADKITVLLDNVVVVTMDNNADLPFYDKDFFLIMNVAMGGTLGGTIDPAFTQDTMEVDYVRVYQ